MHDATAIDSATRRDGIGQVGTAAYGLVGLRLLRGLGHPPGLGPGVHRLSVLLGDGGGYVGRIGAASREVTWATGTSA
jgi:hypothetical protein